MKDRDHKRSGNVKCVHGRDRPTMDMPSPQSASRAIFSHLSHKREPESDFLKDQQEEDDRMNEEDDEDEELIRRQNQDEEEENIYSDDMRPPTPRMA